MKNRITFTSFALALGLASAEAQTPAAKPAPAPAAIQAPVAKPVPAPAAVQAPAAKPVPAPVAVQAPTPAAKPTPVSAAVEAPNPAAKSVSAPAATAKERPAAFGGLGANKDPIKIDADRLDVFDKESRAVFGGNVVAVQGDTTMKCTTLTVFYEQNRTNGGAAKPAAASTPSAEDSAIKKIDCKGPVTIVSKTQIATGDNATFDRVANRVYLLGNVALTDGPNVTRGERIVYDLNSGVANVETAPGGRVKALFVPGSNPEAAAGGGTPAGPTGSAAAKPKPATN